MTDAAAISSCTLTTDARITAVPVCERRTVCYEFDTHASGKPDLDIPYLVIVDGKVQNQGKPRRLERNRKIKLMVNAGSTVALYLNSDVHPNHRSHPVFEVTVTEHDVMVNITEKTGHAGHLNAVVGKATLRSSNGANKPQVAHYQASLTGDIWMRISHRYTEAEARALLPEDISKTVRDAVCNIYRGMVGAMLDVRSPPDGDQRSRALRVQFQRPRNAEENISGCSLLRDVLPRTHPCAFAALFTEALKIGMTEILITSTWRPMYGSIIHRAGLGLDVTTIRDAEGQVQINRAGLTEPGQSHNSNVSDQEKALYREYQTQKRAAEAARRLRKPAIDTSEAGKQWEGEVQKSEPKLMNRLREGLRKQQSVKQIFDPWYMTTNTTTGKPITNEQINSNEITHKNHLHRTVRDADIYE